MGERALGVGGWRDNGWVDLPAFRKFSLFSQSQVPYLTLSKYYFTDEQLKIEAELLASDKDVERKASWTVRLLTMDPEQMTGVDPSDWFNNCTTRIDLMMSALDSL